jgi:hypothetical protein
METPSASAIRSCFNLYSSQPQRQLIFSRHPQESVQSHYPTFETKPITELEQRLRRPDFVVARHLSIGDHLADPRHVHEVLVVEVLGDGISAPGAAPERGGGGKPVRDYLWVPKTSQPATPARCLSQFALHFVAHKVLPGFWAQRPTQNCAHDCL